MSATQASRVTTYEDYLRRYLPCDAARVEASESATTGEDAARRAIAQVEERLRADLAGDGS